MMMAACGSNSPSSASDQPFSFSDSESSDSRKSSDSKSSDSKESSDSKFSSSSFSTNTIYVTDTIYLIKNGNGNIEEWKASDCAIGDRTFYCSESYDCPTEIILCKDNSNGECNGGSGNQETVRNTVKVPLNYGNNPITDYIPYANIPEFNQDSIKSLFAEFENTSCKVLQTLWTNYQIEAVGLPEGLIWYQVEENLYNSVDRYSGNGTIIVEDAQSDTKTCEFFISTMDASISWNSCRVRTLPEKASSATFKLVNNTPQPIADSVIQWKLVYKDQYGRGGTLDMSTRFTKTDSE